jgi:hypothetical protein
MTDAGDGDAQPGEHFDGVRASSNFGFDARGCEQEVHDDSSLGATRRDEASRRKAVSAVLLERSQDPEAAGLQIAHERLRVGVVSHVDDDVHVTGRPWLGSCAHGKSADECPPTSSDIQLARDASQRGLEGVHGRRGQATGLPWASPCSAPGRRGRQASTSASISSWVSCG